MPSKLFNNQTNQNNYSSSSGQFSSSMQTYSFDTTDSSANSYQHQISYKPQQALQTTPKSANKINSNELITSINSINVIFDSNQANSKESSRKSSYSKPNSMKIQIDESPLNNLEPMKDLLHEELLKRMSKERKNSFKETKRLNLISYITNESNSEDVRNFLISKEFSQK